MCFKRNKFRKETLKAIRKMNVELKVNFSYVYCIEEIDILKLIPRDKPTTNKTRLEHLTQVLGLWNKGIKEDFYAHNKTLRKYEKIKPLFDNFLACFVYELNYLGVIDDYSTEFDYSINDDFYKIGFNKYSYETKKQKLDDIHELIGVLDAFELALSKPSRPNFKEDIINTYIKSNYYGPISLIKGYKKIEKNVKRYSFISRTNPFNNTVKANSIFRYHRLLKNRKKLLLLEKREYHFRQIDIQKERLKIELSRLNKEDRRYDFYFDYFIWRLWFDLEYIFLKRLGGIKKVSELININYKDKSKKVIGDNPIVVDVDRMTVITNEKTNSSVDKNVNKSNMNIKEFDQINKEIIFRKEQNEIHREPLEKRK